MRHYKILDQKEYWNRIYGKNDNMSLNNLDYDQFWKESPAAAEIFDYIKSNPSVNIMPYGFDKGGVTDDRTNTWAVFSCVSLTGFGRDILTISASVRDGKIIEIKHNTERHNDNSN